MSLAKNQAACFNLEHIGWKYYNTIKKKAVEQEFSLSGLFISLSIAFFIVIISALFLSFIFNSLENGERRQELTDIYYPKKTIQIGLLMEKNIKYININNRG